jgi:hypothetical protein
MGIKTYRMRIVDYSIISAVGLQDLKRNVLEAMDEGWQPMGGVQLYSSPGGMGVPPKLNFMQVVVKYEENKRIDYSTEG